MQRCHGAPEHPGDRAQGTDFGVATETELDAVADELSDRPRKRLDFAKPTEQLTELLLQ